MKFHYTKACKCIHTRWHTPLLKGVCVKVHAKNLQITYLFFRFYWNWRQGCKLFRKAFFFFIFPVKFTWKKIKVGCYLNNLWFLKFNQQLFEFNDGFWSKIKIKKNWIFSKRIYFYLSFYHFFTKVTLPSDRKAL